MKVSKWEMGAEMGYKGWIETLGVKEIRSAGRYLYMSARKNTSQCGARRPQATRVLLVGSHSG